MNERLPDLPRETDVPQPVLSCPACGADLSGASPEGRCPACGAAFDRDLLLFDADGPEAFVEPPLTRAEREDNTITSPWIAGTILALGLIGAAGVLLVIWVQAFGTLHLPRTVLVCLAIGGIIEWLVIGKLRERREALGEESEPPPRDDHP